MTIAPPTPRSQSVRLDGRTPRTSLTDRIAMRIALWLLLWSSRPERTPRDPRAHRQHLTERELREQRWLANGYYLTRW